MEFHTLASIFPLMTDAEYAALKADIAQYGMRQPIITWQNKIVDGRNRYNVCIELGIEPQFQEWDGNGDLLAFIVSQNLHRRHLNESQRAVIAEQLANMRQGERTDLQPSANLPKVSQDDAAALFNVSPRTIRSVKVIKREAPDMISRIANKLMMMVSRYSKPAYCIMSPFTRCDMDAFKKVLAAYGVELRIDPLCPLSHAYLVPELPSLEDA